MFMIDIAFSNSGIIPMKVFSTAIDRGSLMSMLCVYWPQMNRVWTAHRPGARPTNDISIEFEIRSKLGAL